MAGKDGFPMVAGQDALDELGGGSLAVGAGDGDAEAFRLLETQFEFADHGDPGLGDGLEQGLSPGDCWADHGQAEALFRRCRDAQSYFNTQRSQSIRALAEILVVRAVHGEDPRPLPLQHFAGGASAPAQANY